MNDTGKISGVVTYTLFDVNGKVKQSGTVSNLITNQGDDYYVDRLSDAGAGTAKQFSLGTGAGTPAKGDTWVSGYFSNNGTAVAGSGAVAVTTHPTGGSENTLRYSGTFTAGYATQSGITRIGLSNMNPASDGNGTPNGTTTMFIAHAILDPTVNKGASDTLAVTWDHTFLGA
jgi:hypothetical protein